MAITPQHRFEVGMIFEVRAPLEGWDFIGLITEIREFKGTGVYKNDKVLIAVYYKIVNGMHPGDDEAFFDIGSHFDDYVKILPMNAAKVLYK